MKQIKEVMSSNWGKKKMKKNKDIDQSRIEKKIMSYQLKL